MSKRSRQNRFQSNKCRTSSNDVLLSTNSDRRRLSKTSQSRLKSSVDAHPVKFLPKGRFDCPSWFVSFHLVWSNKSERRTVENLIPNWLLNNNIKNFTRWQNLKMLLIDNIKSDLKTTWPTPCLIHCCNLTNSWLISASKTFNPLHPTSVTSLMNNLCSYLSSKLVGVDNKVFVKYEFIYLPVR